MIRERRPLWKKEVPRIDWSHFAPWRCFFGVQVAVRACQIGSRRACSTNKVCTNKVMQKPCLPSPEGQSLSMAVCALYMLVVMFNHCINALINADSSYLTWSLGDRVMFGKLLEQVIHQPPCFMYDLQELSTKHFHSLLFALLQDTILQIWRRAEWATTRRIEWHVSYCIVAYPYFGIWCNIVSYTFLCYPVLCHSMLSYAIVSFPILYCLRL